MQTCSFRYPLKVQSTTVPPSRNSRPTVGKPLPFHGQNTRLTHEIKKKEIPNKLQSGGEDVVTPVTENDMRGMIEAKKQG